jgi:hypothetical protein
MRNQSTYTHHNQLTTIGSVKGRIMDNAAKPGLIEHEGLYRNLLTESTTQRPVYEGSEIDIPFTNVNLDITQFNESYVELRPTIN